MYLFCRGYDTNNAPSSLLSTLGPRFPVEVLPHQGKLSRAHRMLVSDTTQLTLVVPLPSKGPGFEIVDEPAQLVQPLPPHPFAPGLPPLSPRDGMRLRSIPVAVVPLPLP